MAVHAYSLNGLPQLRLGFPNGWTASIVVSGDGSVALARFPTRTDDVDPKRFTPEQRSALAAEVQLGNQQATATELMLYLLETEALPKEE